VGFLRFKKAGINSFKIEKLLRKIEEEKPKRESATFI
jgi:hypothetical protein